MPRIVSSLCRLLLLLLRSNAGMVMSDLEVDVLDELGSSLKSSFLDPHSLSRKSAPDGKRFRLCVNYML